MLVVHGGAGAAARDAGCEQGIQSAIEAGWAILRAGGSALDAVETAVAGMEDDPVFNAGYGSCLTSDGRLQMDALIMEGATLRAGAVACVERVRNPIRLARRILETSPHVLFAGPGADRLAEALGLELCANEALITDRARQRLQLAGDTVGAVALDAAGNLAAATSTGGMTGKPPGRVGDSPLIGCGCYADNDSGAVSTTGWGEGIMRTVLGKWAVDRLVAGHEPRQAAEQAIAYLQRRVNGSGGLILLDRQGHYGAAWNTAAMPWAASAPAAS